MADNSSELKIIKLLRYLNISDMIDKNILEMDNEIFDEIVGDVSFLKLFSEMSGSTEDDKERILKTFRFIHDVGVLTAPSNTISINHAVNRKYLVAVYKWPLNIRLPFFHSAAKSVSNLTRNAIPKNYYHVGVVVFNTLHHFGVSGLQQHFEMPANWIKNSEFGLQSTNKTRNEFDHWFHQASERYKAANYHFAKNNCISFTQDLAKFLDVKVDSDIIELQNWLRSEQRHFEEMPDGTLKEEVTLQMNKFFKTLRKNPVIAALLSSGIKLKGLSSRASLGVKDSVMKMFQVDQEIESLYTLSNTGGLYDKSIGAAQF